MGIKAKQTVTIVDDLDGKEFETDAPDDFKVIFGWGGKRWQVYLSEASRTKVEKFLKPMLDNATDATPVTAAPAKKRAAKKTAIGTPTEDRTAMREWLRENGHDVSDRGNIKKELKDAYYAANPDAAA